MKKMICQLYFQTIESILKPVNPVNSNKTHDYFQTIESILKPGQC